MCKVIDLNKYKEDRNNRIGFDEEHKKIFRMICNELYGKEDEDKVRIIGKIESVLRFYKRRINKFNFEGCGKYE